MKKEKANHVLTNLGFDWGDMAIERCFESNGHQCVRIRSMKTGTYIDVQMSKGGRNMFAYTKKRSSSLKGFDPCGSKKRIEL
jgi:hypothetical protein